MKKVTYLSEMKVWVTSLGKDPRPCDVLAEGERKYNREWPGIIHHPEETDFRERLNELCSFKKQLQHQLGFSIVSTGASFSRKPYNL